MTFLYLVHRIGSAEDYRKSFQLSYGLPGVFHVGVKMFAELDGDDD